MLKDFSRAIGGGPLVRLNRLISGANAPILAKVETRNPSGSIKDRTALSMINDARSRGLLTPGRILIEPTSGNTGLALAIIAASLGLELMLVCPETISEEKRRMLKAYGAHVELTEASAGLKGAIQRVRDRAAGDPRLLPLQQFDNPANPRAHEQTTGPEIWRATAGSIDILVSGVGTGGTITGISRYIKKTCGKPIQSVAVEPEKSPVLSQFISHRMVQPQNHRIHGIGPGFVPEVLDLSLVDTIEQVSEEESVDYVRRLARDEGILAGVSSGAALAVADRLARKPENRGKTLVVLLPDSGERYLSSGLFD